MAIKQQEKNFLISIGVIGAAIGLFLLLSPMLSSQSSPTDRPEPSEERVRVEVAKPVVSAPKIEKKLVPKLPEPKPPAAEKTTSAESPKSATLVLNEATSVPTDYFNDGSGVTEVPRVVERYLDKINNGARFMGRLEAIALQDAKVLAERREESKSAESVRLERGDSTKVISFNMKIKKPFLSATFDTEAAEGFAGDVLVDWIDQASNRRVELFFTPVILEGSEGHFRLKMPDDAKLPSSDVFVYAASDDMPLIGRGSYKP